VLDVEALLGAEDVRVWLFRNQFDVGTNKTKRSTRVDIQRVGGYDGKVDLDVDGLASAIGSASFGSASLTGLTGLGTNVSLTLKLSAPEGQHDLSVRGAGSGGSPSGSRALGVKIDRTGPAISDLRARLRGSNAALDGRGIAQSIVQWDGSDALSALGQMTLQRKIGSKAWKRVGISTSEHLRIQLKPGQTNQFRINAADTLGNKTQSAAIGARLQVRDSDSTKWTRPASGGWLKKRVKNAQGGSLLIANQPAAGLQTSFPGKAVAVVAPVGPGRGKLRVRIDGGPWHVVSLKAAKPAQRRVVFGRLVEDGQHAIEIEGYQGQTAVDAVLILR
jgi:hypothetical protein